MTQEVFEAEIFRLTGSMYRISFALLPRHQDRQDAVQSAILKAWQHKDRLRDESKFKSFLLKILTNECYSYLRKAKRELCIPLPEPGVPPKDDSLKEAISSLPEKLRVPVVLHYAEGATEEEIASILRIPRGTVKSRLNKARLLLRQSLSEEV